LCQKNGYENAMVYSTSTEKYNEMKQTVSTNYHWKPTETFVDKQGGEHYIFNWSNYNIEFVKSDEMQVLLYNRNDIQVHKIEKQKQEHIADSIALVESARSFRLKQIQDSLAAIKAKKENDSIKRVNAIAAVIEKRNLQSKMYDLHEFDIYNKVYSNIIEGISDYLRTFPSRTRINEVYKIKVTVDTNNKIQ
jgi:hypothetical protein